MVLGIIEVLLYFVCILFSVAFLTVAERKTLGYFQRRIGPNVVGYYGMLQAFADAIKCLIKEIIIPKESNKAILIIAPMITLVTGLLGWLVVPIGPALTLGNLDNGILYSLAIGSIGIFGTLLSGWSSNSKYAFLGTIRSTAQLISYELILTTIYIICIMTIGTLNITLFIEYQRSLWLIIPLFPLFIIFFISTIAETNRPPFDLVEAESELVAGFFTEYSGSPFVFFFLAEYSNIMLMCSATSILFLGGYLYIPIIGLDYIYNLLLSTVSQYSILYYIIEGLLYGSHLAIKLIILMFTFIWVRASFPRFTYDNLIHFCWLILLPLLFGIVLVIPIILYIYNSLPLLI